MTQELIERLLGLHHRDGPPSIYGEAADALQSQSACIAELEGELARWKLLIGTGVGASLTKDSTSG